MNSILKKNLLYAFVAQSSSLLLSIIMSLIIPKFLSIENYGYWQLFLFYVSYAGFFHFGLTDGIYLKLGGKTFNEIDKKDLKFQTVFLLTIQMVIIIGIISISMFVKDNTKSIILLISSIYIAIANLNWLLGYIFQATNNTKIYSISVIIDRSIFIFLIIISFVIKINNIYYLMILYTITRMTALVYCMIKYKSILQIKLVIRKEYLKNTLEYIKIGMNLMLASIASMLILGIGRFFVEKKWGVESFSVFSFSISITNFFLVFIQQVSMVMFPALRQIKDIGKLKIIYKQCRHALNIILPSVFIVYIPCKVILSLWLPKYEQSLNYLAILLPICVFDGKMQMLSNTYMKVYRKEKLLLIINIIAMFFSFILSVIGTYILENVYVIIFGLLFSIILRSILSEIYLAKKMECNIYKESKYIVMEIIISIVFIFSNMNFTNIISFIINIFVYSIYIILLKDNFIELINLFKSKFLNKYDKSM